MNRFTAYQWASTLPRAAIALATTVAFAWLARALRGVNASGALAGGVACLLLFAGAGPGAFAVLVGLFLLTWASTRWGRHRKQEMGVAERHDGRNGWQVGANLAVAAGCAMLFAFRGNRVWIVAMIAALAEAATDTVASEIGQTTRRNAFLTTNWKTVPAGTDGGITAPGSFAGIAGGSVIAILGAVCGVIGWRELWIPIVAGSVGMLADSLLGATLQRRGWMSNEAVNFWGTLAAAGLAWVASS